MEELREQGGEAQSPVFGETKTADHAKDGGEDKRIHPELLRALSGQPGHALYFQSLCHSQPPGRFSTSIRFKPHFFLHPEQLLTSCEFSV